METMYRLNNGHLLSCLGLHFRQGKVLEEDSKLQKMVSQAPILLVDLDRDDLDLVVEIIDQVDIVRHHLFIIFKLKQDPHVPLRNRLLLALNRLNLTYCDSLVVEKGKEGQGMIDLYQSLEEIYQEGLALSLGLWSMEPSDLNQVLAFSRVIPAIHVFDLSQKWPSLEMVEFCQKHQMQVVVTGLNQASDLVDSEKLALLTYKLDSSPEQILIRYCLENKMTVLLDVTTQEEETVFDVFGFNLDDKDRAMIDTLKK